MDSSIFPFIATQVGSFISNLWSFLSGTEMSNFGSFLSGTGTWIIFVYGCFKWQHWVREKSAEKQSTIAEESLNHLESSIGKANSWIIEASCAAFVYSKDSPENAEQYRRASKAEQEVLQKEYRGDPYEVRNFCRGFHVIKDEFIIAKNCALRLDKQDINLWYDELDLIFKKLPPRVFRFYDSRLSVKDKNDLEAFITDEAPKKIEELFNSIRNKLFTVLKYDIT